jgi:crossover junction endodeoxyribonuclease RuvC
LRTLGIDPGTHVTGYGIVKKHGYQAVHVAHGEIRLLRSEPFPRCLAKIYDGLAAVIREWKPEFIAVEDIFFGKNVKSLIRQGHVRGVTLLVAAHNDIPVYEYTPLEVKKAVVGYGRAEKSQVQQMVRAILSLEEVPPEDASDALAVAICHTNTMKAALTL